VVGALLGLCVLGSGCGGDDESCGPGDLADPGLTLARTDGEVRFGEFTSSPNNDCTSGEVTSLTIEGRQVEPSGESPGLVLCAPAPDRIDETAVALDDESRIQIIDLFGAIDGCTLTLDRQGQVSGTILFSGFCDNGTSASGYAITLDGELPINESCVDSEDSYSVALRGTAHVVAE
jgi:hypothetical protein